MIMPICCRALTLLAAATAAVTGVARATPPSSPTTAPVHAKPLQTIDPAEASPILHGLVYHDLRYGPAAGSRNLLDLYVPARRSDRPWPLIVFVHGGGWISGDKSDIPSPSDLLRLGFAVASINYRLTSDAVFPAQLHDCKGAVRYLRSIAAQLNLDDAHVGAFGISAGGQLAGLLGTTGNDPDLEGNVGGNLDWPSRVQAVLDWFGPTDLTTIIQQMDPTTAPDFMKHEPTLLTRLLGGKVEEKQALARIASPAHHVDKDDAPFLILHGNKDPIVPIAQSVAFDAALRAAGVPSRLIVVDGGNHGGGDFGSVANLHTMLMFFRSHLIPKDR